MIYPNDQKSGENDTLKLPICLVTFRITGNIKLIVSKKTMSLHYYVRTIWELSGND